MLHAGKKNIVNWVDGTTAEASNPSNETQPQRSFGNQCSTRHYAPGEKQSVLHDNSQKGKIIYWFHGSYTLCLISLHPCTLLFTIYYYCLVLYTHYPRTSHNSVTKNSRRKGSTVRLHYVIDQLLHLCLEHFALALSKWFHKLWNWSIGHSCLCLSSYSLCIISLRWVFFPPQCPDKPDISFIVTCLFPTCLLEVR